MNVTLGPYILTPGECYDFTNEFNRITFGSAYSNCTWSHLTMTNPSIDTTNTTEVTSAYQDTWYATNPYCYIPSDYSWTTSAWSQCVSSSIQTRNVSCTDSVGNHSPSSTDCNATQPSAQQSCIYNQPTTITPAAAADDSNHQATGSAHAIGISTAVVVAKLLQLV